jgi:hypothetical protein
LSRKEIINIGELLGPYEEDKHSGKREILGYAMAHILLLQIKIS